MLLRKHALANTMQTTLITLLLSFMVHDEPSLWFVLRWIAVLLPSTLTLGLMFIPKVVMIHWPALGRDLARLGQLHVVRTFFELHGSGEFGALTSFGAKRALEPPWRDLISKMRRPSSPINRFF